MNYFRTFRDMVRWQQREPRPIDFEQMEHCEEGLPGCPHGAVTIEGPYRRLWTAHSLAMFEDAREKWRAESPVPNSYGFGAFLGVVSMLALTVGGVLVVGLFLAVMAFLAWLAQGTVASWATIGALFVALFIVLGVKFVRENTRR